MKVVIYERFLRLGRVVVLMAVLFSVSLTEHLPAQILLKSPLSETTSEERQIKWREAHQQVQEGRPSDALSLYQELLDSPSGILFFNSGVAYQMMGELGEAKAMFLAASAFPETKELSQRAIEEIDALLPFKMASIPRYPWQKVYDYLIQEIGIRFLVWTGAFTLYLLVAGLLWMLFSSSRKQPLTLLIPSAVGFLAVLAILFIRQHDVNHFVTGVVTATSVSLIENPDLELESTTIAYEGAVFRADLRESRTEEGWVYVTLQNGAQGWLMENNFKAVPF